MRASKSEAALGAAPVLGTQRQTFETKKNLAPKLSALTAWSHFFWALNETFSTLRESSLACYHNYEI
jgi:hypothetical protein